MNIYVGNLPHETTEEQLKQVFEAFGKVDGVNLIKDRQTGESRGFGFVQMPSALEGKAAIEAMNGSDSLGRPLKVEESKPSPGRASRGGGFEGGFGGDRGGRGGDRGGRGGGRGRGGFGGGGRGRGSRGGGREGGPSRY